MSDSTGPGEVRDLPTELVLRRYGVLAARIIQRRKARRALLPQGMLVDVAWDLLLHLLAHRGDPRQLSTDAIGESAGLSSTVARRWLSLLQADGLVLPRPRQSGSGWELSGPFLQRLIAYLREYYEEAH